MLSHARGDGSSGATQRTAAVNMIPPPSFMHRPWVAAAIAIAWLTAAFTLTLFTSAEVRADEALKTSSPDITLSRQPVVPTTIYRPAGQWLTLAWPNGGWDGSFKFPKVYCLKFPDPSTASRLLFGFYNEGAISYAELSYPDGLTAFIVTSAIPAGREASAEMARMLANERKAEAAYGISYNISETTAAFGTTLSLRIKDVAPRSPAGPFPLVRPTLRPAKTPIESLSVHRLCAWPGSIRSGNVSVGASSRE